MSNNNVWGGCIRSYILCKLYFYLFSTSWNYVVVMNGVIRPYHRRGFLCLASPYYSTIIIINCQTVRITISKNLSWTLRDAPILRYYTKHTWVRWRVESWNIIVCPTMKKQLEWWKINWLTCPGTSSSPSNNTLAYCWLIVRTIPMPHLLHWCYTRIFIIFFWPKRCTPPTHGTLLHINSKDLI